MENMCSIGEQNKCTLCDYKTKRKYNLERHMVTKHHTTQISQMTAQISQMTAQNAQMTAQNAQMTAQISQNDSPNLQNDILNTTCYNNECDNINNNIDSVDSNKCTKCEKIYSSAYKLKEHVANCKGRLCALSCDFCKATFAHRQSKYRHLKICKKKAEADSQALTVISPENQITSAAQNQIVSGAKHTVQENAISIVGNNHCDIKVQNNVNILVFGENMEFLKDHISNDTIHKWLRENPQNNENVVRKYSREIMKRKENQCVKKTNLRLPYSKVHVGDDTWETHRDNEVFAKMMCSICDGFSNWFNLSRRQKYKNVDKFVDYMADNGYCNQDDEAEAMRRCFKNLVRDLKLATFDNTKADT